jgi:hypothetical protein
MKRQRLNTLSPAQRAELNRLLNDAVETGLIRPSKSEFGSPKNIVRKVYGSLRLCIDYRGLNEVTRKSDYPLPRVVNDTHNELKDAYFYTHIDVANSYARLDFCLASNKFEFVKRTSTRQTFKPMMVGWSGSCNAHATF